VREELIDGPLVVGVLAVLRRDDVPVAGDEEVGRNAELAATRKHWRDSVWGPHDSSDRAQEDLGQPDQQARVEQCPCGALDAKGAVDLLGRVGDDGERQVWLVADRR
jgi:hypothetical protein